CPDPTARRATPPHPAVRCRTRRPTRSHTHEAVPPEHGPPADLRHPRRLRGPERPRHPAPRPRFQAPRRPTPRGPRPGQPAHPLAVRERRPPPPPVAAPRRARGPVPPGVRHAAAPPHPRHRRLRRPGARAAATDHVPRLLRTISVP